MINYKVLNLSVMMTLK